MPHVFRCKHQHTGTDIDMNRPVDFHIRWAASTERASAVRVVVERAMCTLQLISSFNLQSRRQPDVRDCGRVSGAPRRS